MKLFHSQCEASILTLAVQQPEKVDVDVIAAIFPYGQVTVNPVKGGLDAPREDGGNPTVIANVAISVALDVEVAA